MGQKDFIIAFALIFLFSFGLISYAVGFGIDNNAVVNLANDSEFSGYESTGKTDMIEYSVDVNASSKGFEEASIESGDETTETGTFTKNPPKKPMDAFKTIFKVGYQKLFGADPEFYVVFATILGTILFIGILLAWKTWKGGNPE